MASGFNYHLTPEEEKNEVYNVKTGDRRQGAFKLDIANLVSGTVLKTMTPMRADFANRKAYACINVEVYETYTTSDTAKSLKIKKGSLAYSGMFIGTGSKGAKVTAIDKSNADYDELTLDEAIGANVAVGKVMFEATAAGGTVIKNQANSALFGRMTVGKDDMATLLYKACEIDVDKLPLPISAKDKEGMKLFLFNE